MLVLRGLIVSSRKLIAAVPIECSRNRFSKVFDRVWHDGLLVKVEAAGIRGSALAWIRSFLSPRRQITMIEGFSSSSIEIRAGFPQGAILSPLLFSIYVNDIVSAAPLCDTNLFADDTSAHVSSPCPTLLNTSLQSAADSSSDWFDRWHLSIHPSKTVCMALRTRGMPPCPLYIYINGKRIAQVSQHCHLGVAFNDTLSWKDHVHKIVLQSAVHGKLVCFAVLAVIFHRLSCVIFISFVSAPASSTAASSGVA